LFTPAVPALNFLTRQFKLKAADQTNNYYSLDIDTFGLAHAMLA